MADNPKNMRLATLLIKGMTHGFTINRQTFIGMAKLSIPVAQSKIKLVRVNASQQVSNRGSARNRVVAMTMATT